MYGEALLDAARTWERVGMERVEDWDYLEYPMEVEVMDEGVEEREEAVWVWVWGWVRRWRRRFFHSNHS